MTPTFSASPFDFNMTPSALPLPENIPDDVFTPEEITGITLPIIILILVTIYCRFCRRRNKKPTVKGITKIAAKTIELMNTNPLYNPVKTTRTQTPTRTVVSVSNPLQTKVVFNPTMVRGKANRKKGGYSKKFYRKLNIKRTNKTRKQRGGTEDEDLLNILNLMIAYYVPNFLSGNPLSLLEINHNINSLFDQIDI